jgi:hypothetical protein
VHLQLCLLDFHLQFYSNELLHLDSPTSGIHVQYVV